MNDLVTIAYVPQHNPEMPFLAPAVLKAKLNQSGIESKVIDANVEFYHHALSRDVQSELYNSGVDLEGRLDYIEDASVTLRSPLEKEDVNKYLEAKIIVEKALGHFADSYSGNLGLGYASLDYDARDSEQVLKAIEDREKNPYIEFFEKDIDKYTAGDFLGISIGVPEQIISGFTLAKLAKEKNPDLTIVLGGNMFSRVEKEIEASGLARYYDYGIAKEGEEKLTQLVKDVRSGKSRKDILSMLESDDLACPNIREEPTPDFSDYPIAAKGEPNTYFSSELVFPVQGARGCYHNKCSFCSIPKMNANGGRGRGKNPKQVFEDTKSHFEKFSVTSFKFVEEAIMPRMAKGYAELVSESGLPFKAEAYVMVDDWINRKEFDDIGKVFKSFWFGLESCAEGSRDNMGKSGAMESVDADKIINRIYDLGIMPNAFLMAGIFGETWRDLDCTREYVEENMKLGTAFLSVYELATHSRDATNKKLQERYGFRNVRLPGDLAASYQWEDIQGNDVTTKNRRMAEDFYDKLFVSRPDFLVTKALPLMTMFDLVAQNGPDVGREISTEENIRLANQITKKMWTQANLDRKG